MVTKNFIEYNGKKIGYNNFNDLSKKLNIYKNQSKDLIKQNKLGKEKEIIIFDIDGNVGKVSLQKKGFRNTLKKQYGIKKVTNKELFKQRNVKYNKAIVDSNIGLGPKTNVNKLIINLTVFIVSSSDAPRIKQKLLDKAPIKIDSENEKKILELDNSEYLVSRSKLLPYNGKVEDIDNFVKENAKNYTGGKMEIKVLYYYYTIQDIYKKSTFKIENSFLKDFDNEYSLEEWCNIIYDYRKGEDSCVVSFIGTKFPKLYWKIKKLEDEGDITFNKFCIFLDENDIGYYFYDERNKIIRKKLVYTKGLIHCIVYNNHIYPIRGEKLIKTKPKNIKLIDNGDEKLNELLENNIVPFRLKIDEIKADENNNVITELNIVSFCDKKTKYICNQQYNKCINTIKKIFNDCNINETLLKKIPDNISTISIPDFILKHFKSESYVSYLPEKYQFIKKPYDYRTTKEIDTTREIITIDKNKSYPYCLANLPFLIKFDFRKDAVHKVKKDIPYNKIVDHYIYICEPKESTILMPDTSHYSGYHVKLCLNEDIDFVVHEYWECEAVYNPFNILINSMYKNMEPKDFKLSANIMIGKFERCINYDVDYYYTHIADKENEGLYEGFTRELGDHTLFFKDKENITNIRDCIPIAMQIKDKSREILFNKINELNIKDVIQIKTDSISYYGNKYPKNLDPNDFNGWKKSDFKELPMITSIMEKKTYIPTVRNLNHIQSGYGKVPIRILHNKYAGAGKTHYIINELIPRLEREGKTYIVLTPTHQTLAEYISLGINCKIMQRYHLVRTQDLPTEDYIIIDEIGIVDSKAHDTLEKLRYLEKDYECFGDFNQMLAPMETKPLNQKHYLRYMFNEIDNEYTNYRNNFTTEYYDSLINSTDQDYLINEVNKYSCDYPEEADCIICFRTEKADKFQTRDHYNNLIMGGTSINTEKTKIICINNKLLEQYNIYNHMILEVVKDNGEVLKLKDENNKKYKLQSKEIKHFRPAYCLNCYEVQGMSLNSYYWAPEDDKFLTPRMAYTIISRLKN